MILQHVRVDRHDALNQPALPLQLTCGAPCWPPRVPCCTRRRSALMGDLKRRVGVIQSAPAKAKGWWEKLSHPLKVEESLFLTYAAQQIARPEGERPGRRAASERGRRPIRCASIVPDFHPLAEPTPYSGNTPRRRSIRLPHPRQDPGSLCVVPPTLSEQGHRPPLSTRGRTAPSCTRCTINPKCSTRGLPQPQPYNM